MPSTFASLFLGTEDIVNGWAFPASIVATELVNDFNKLTQSNVEPFKVEPRFFCENPRRLGPKCWDFYRTLGLYNTLYCFTVQENLDSASLNLAFRWSASHQLQILGSCPCFVPPPATARGNLII
jgi:hypothetical protein